MLQAGTPSAIPQYLYLTTSDTLSGGLSVGGAKEGQKSKWLHNPCHLGDPQQGGGTKPLHKPCCLRVSKVERNQMGYITPTIFGPQAGEEVFLSGTILGTEGPWDGGVGGLSWGA